MCGIAGLLGSSNRSPPGDLAGFARAMAATLALRGPDDAGDWWDPDAAVALSFRRLAVLDLTPTGHQPMVSADGRFIIVINGEIYNHQVLRRELEAAGIRFRGTSDTETVLEAVAHWGLDTTLPKLNGMFAFALWDRRHRTLALARDAIGQKPLYWGCIGKVFAFASELKALRAVPGWIPEIDRNALSAYMRLGYVPGPYSIYSGVNKLQPGCLLTVEPGRRPVTRAYWDVWAIARSRPRVPAESSLPGALEQAEALLRHAIRRHMISDVPFGAFLSGGIDSSTIVALMQSESSRPVRTFTIGFDEPGYDEAPYARAVARHLGTDHTELYVGEREALAMVPNLAEVYDEPFADTSQIPTRLLARLARENVTVALSGDGGDELFYGYDRYFEAERIWTQLRSAPNRGAAQSFRALLRAAALVARRLRHTLPATPVLASAEQWLRRAADLHGPDTPGELYRRLLTHWPAPEELVRGGREPPTPLWNDTIFDDLGGEIGPSMQLIDMLTYLPDDILVKVDRASMSVSLEVRAPLLDREVVEFAWQLPRQLVVSPQGGKQVLREILNRHVPAALFDRPKRGFGAPIGAWLRGPLRDWAESLLNERRLAGAGWLDPRPIRRRWFDHLEGRADWQYPLWDVLMFEQWRERWMTPGAVKSAPTATDHRHATSFAPASR